MTIFKTRILVKDIASENLVFRDTVQDLFAIVKKSKKKQVILDFSAVKSISRSFAHEYVNQMKQHQIRIKEVNISRDVKKMFDSVKKAQKKSIPLFLDDTQQISINDVLIQRNKKSFE